MTWLLGIDAGLTNVKAALFSTDGAEAAVEVRQPADSQPAPGHEERDPEMLWATVADAVTEIIATGPAEPEDIAAVGVAGHGHGLYLLDNTGTPVRPGIKSTDSRATGVVEDWKRAGLTTDVRSITGYAPFVADPLSLLGWIKREEPANYDRINHIVFCKDYLKYRLTGTITTDEMEASVFYDIDREEYSDDLFDLLDLGDCFECLPPMVPSWEPCGEVTKQAADEIGLPSGIPVASGLHDIGATALGSGVYSPGQAMLIVGTWGQSIVVHADPGTGDGIPRRFLEDAWLRYKGNRSAASCVDWFVEACCADWEEQAAVEGIDPYTYYNRQVASVPPGAEGVVFHPYLHGSTDAPSARAGFYGISGSHTKAHLLRAIYEGVAVTQCERLTELSPPDGFTDVRLGGGGSKSEVWCAMFADILDNPIEVPAGSEAGARGVAICAGIAAGELADHDEGVARMVDLDNRYVPEPDRVETYRVVRKIFEDALVAMEPVWERLRRIRVDGDTHA